MAAAYNWGNILQVVVLFLWCAGFVLVVFSDVALDYPAYEARVDRIINNPGDVAACQAAADLGDTSCVHDFYIDRAWSTVQWWVLYGPALWWIVETFFIAVYLMFQKYGWTWFLMIPFVGVGMVIFITAAVWGIVMWVNCGHYSACSNARFVYDFTGNVKKDVATYWIVHNVGIYVLVLLHVAWVLASIATQACLSRSVNGRDTGLDPLFTESDAEAINRANDRVESGIDMAERRVLLPAHIAADISRLKGSKTQ